MGFQPEVGKYPYNPSDVQGCQEALTGPAWSAVCLEQLEADRYTADKALEELAGFLKVQGLQQGSGGLGHSVHLEGS